MKGKKGILAKAVSVLVAIAILAGITPVLELPTAQAAGETVEYNLKQYGSGDFESGKTYSIKIANYNPTEKHTAKDLNWDYYDMQVAGGWQYFQLRGYDFKLQLGVGDWVALELDAPAAGTYSPKLNFVDYSMNTVEARFKTYLIPKSVLTDSTVAAEIADDDYLIGNVNSNTNTTTTKEQPVATTLKQVQLNNENQILVIKSNDNSGTCTYLYNFTLNSEIAADSDIDTIKASIENPVIMKGDTAQITLSDAKTLDGTAASIDGATVTYASSADSVASVDATGKITANAVGNAQITVTVVSGAGFAVDTVDVTVDAILDYTDTVKTYDIGSTADTDWADIGFTAGSAAETSNNIRNWNPLYSPDYRKIEPGVWHGIKINTPNPGKYLARLDYFKHKSAGKFNVHIIPSSVVSEATLKADLDAAVKTGNYKKATYDAMDTTLTKEAAKVLSIPNVEIKSPEHYVLFEMAEGSQSQYNWINDFTLNGKASALTSVELNSQAQAVEAGSTVNVSVAKAFGQDGKEIADLSGMSVSYASSNSEVAEVNGNGVVTGVKAGSADITVTAVIDGETAYATSTITVSNKPVEIENAAIFGDVSAYITKTDAAITFTAFSGINSTEYSEVGFYINGKKVKIDGNNVYKNIKVTYNSGDTEITTANFYKDIAAPANAYVFFSSDTVEAKSTVSFQPYAVSIDGATETKGHLYSVTLS